MSATPDLFDPAGPVALATSKCLLCSRKSSVLALFLPSDSQLWGAATGRDRTVVYGLCPTCFDRPGVENVVEERLFRFVAGGAA